MPELPEVETIRTQLDESLKDLKIADIDILGPKNFLGRPQQVIGKKVLGVKRRAKITLVELEDNFYLAIHLKLTGQLIYREKGEAVKYCDQKEGPFAVCELPNKFTRVIISFDNGSKLYFNDLRMFGWVKIIQKSKIKNQNYNSKLKNLDEALGFGRLGPEANDEKSFTLEYFRGLLAKSREPVKLLILDQEKLAGIGNIYANEALFIAGIAPTRPANSLSEEEIRRLRRAIIKVLNEAIKHKGTSDRDEAYRQTTGEKGEHQNFLQVYGKTGQPCSRCGGRVERITLGGRGTFFCRKCQK